MKNKGFTLVELLVVMVILAIITAISIPLIRNVRQSNDQREYEQFSKSIRYAAKLYVDSYAEDLFGHEESGCVLIPYEELKNKNLVKDIDINGVSCESEDTYAKVVKLGNKYGYAVTIGCGKKDEKGVVTVSYRYPKEGITTSETCDVNADTIMSFRTNITNPTSLNYKSRAMKVIVSSNTGINGNPIIQYGFSTGRNSNIVGNWDQLSINPPVKAVQASRIEAGETIEVTSNEIRTPEGLTGKYYLVLRIDRLQDISGKNWAREGYDSYVYIGPYTIDNEAPDFNDSTVISSNVTYNALKPKLNLKVTDNLSASNETQAKSRLKMCTSYGTDTCGKTKTAFADSTKYIAYDPTKVLDNIKSALDGSKNKVYVTVVDPAGNYKTKEFEYELASVITYNGNRNTGGATEKTYCNNNTDCPLRENGFTRTGYRYTGWYNAASGGTKYGATVRLTGNITVYAGWEVITYNITYNLNGGNATNNATYTVETASFTLNNPTKTGYTFTGWTGSNGNTPQTSVTISKGSTGDRTYNANYRINSYTITYNGNTNTGGSTSSTTCNYMENCSLRANGFTKNGYNFAGWFTAATGGSQYGASTQLTGNITVYAHWVDNIAPTCSTSKVGGVGSQGGVKVRVTCSDAGSGCREATHDYNSQKSNQTYTVYDNAGNSGTCTVSISKYDCNSYQYVCGSYACGSYPCGTYECGGHMEWDEGDGVYGGGGGISGYWYWVPKYCTAYCTSYCNSYCTGWNTCYR